MNNNDEKNFELEARVVAWVLGEASAFEVAELERLCAEQPELAVFKRRIEAVHGLTGEAVKPAKEPLRLSAERRAKVLAVIGGAGAAPAKPKKSAKRFEWRAWALPMAACLVLMLGVSAVIIPTVGSTKKPKRPAPSQTLIMSQSVEQDLPAESAKQMEAPLVELYSRSDDLRSLQQNRGQVREFLGDVSAASASAPASGLKLRGNVSAVKEHRGNGYLGGVVADRDTFSDGFAAPAPVATPAPEIRRQAAEGLLTGVAQQLKQAEVMEALSELSQTVADDEMKNDAVSGLISEEVSGRREGLAGVFRARRSVVGDEGKDEPFKRVATPIDEALRAEILSANEAVSTFSLHVSDASFRLAKAALERGQAPDAAMIRPEEFYNAFDYGDPSPAAGEAVSCRVEQAAHPFLQQRNLVRIAMKVPAAGRGAGQPLRLTVMLDTSGSMEREDRAATVRAALTALTTLLGHEDRVTLVGFARTPRLLAENVAGDEAGRIIELAARTPAEGGTNLEEALVVAGELALRHKVDGAQNRIVLLTDGAANLGDADPQALAKRVEALRQNGIAFDACGVVADGLDDSVLEALTRKGDGRYAVINSPEEADAGFARKLAGAFRPAAKDVKVQVHFNPARVAKYRLIGFEKHRLKTEDFRNDAVDAAELAAEEAAVAVYQVEVLPEGEGELGEVAVRFLDTRSNERVERSWALGYTAQPAAFERATASMQLAGSAAFLAEKLRGGALAGQVRLNEFAPVVEGLGAAYPQAERVHEFIRMFRLTRRLTGE